MKDKVLAILETIRPDVEFEKEQKLIDEEILDSFDVIQIVTELMEAFDIYIDADDIEPENLNTLQAIIQLVESKKV